MVRGYKREGVTLLADDRDLAILALSLGPCRAAELAERMGENRGKVRTALSRWHPQERAPEYIVWPSPPGGTYTLTRKGLLRARHLVKMLLDLRMPPRGLDAFDEMVKELGEDIEAIDEVGEEIDELPETPDDASDEAAEG